LYGPNTNFEGKLQRLIERISKIVGLPTNLTRRAAKYLLKGRPDLKSFPNGVDFHVFEVEKVYLVNQDPDEEAYSFVRKRTTIDRNGNPRGTVHQLTTVQRAEDGEAIEQKRIITAREYATAFKSRDLSRHVVSQERISFLYRLQSFNIHVSITIFDGGFPFNEPNDLRRFTNPPPRACVCCMPRSRQRKVKKQKR
jgi:hypothetical protein